MIKISISKGQTAITLEADGHELKNAMNDAYELFKQMQDSNPVIPFEEKEIVVNDVIVPEGTVLTEEELDMIENSKAEAAKRRQEAEEEMAAAQVEIAKAQLAKELAKEKEADDAENEARATRAKARKRRDLLYRLAQEDSAVTVEMTEEKEMDEMEAKLDKKAQIAYDSKYAPTPAEEKTEIKTEVKEEKPAATKPVEKVTPKAEVKTEPKAEVKPETETEVKEEETAEESNEDTDGTKKVMSIFAKQALNKGSLEQAINKSMEVLKGKGLSKVDSTVSIMLNVTEKEPTWLMMTRRPDTLQKKFNLSKTETDEVIKLMTK